MGDSVALSSVETQKVKEWIAARGTPQQVALHCRIVAGAAAGERDSAIARRPSVNRNTVILWRKRFAESGLDDLWDIAPGRGQCYQRHRHQEFLKFLGRLDREFPGDIPLHLIMDNYALKAREGERAAATSPPGLCLISCRPVQAG